MIDCYSASISSKIYSLSNSLMVKYEQTMIKKYLLLLLTDITVLLLGVLLAFSFAPYEIFPFAIIAEAGLLALWLRVSAKRAFWQGFLFGLGLFGAGVYWVFHSIHFFGGVPTLPASAITSLFIAVLALFPASCGYLLNRYFPIETHTKMVCAFPAIWVFSESMRGILFTGFPWLLVGYSQTHSPLKGFAPLLSVYGVSLAALVSSGLIVSTLKKLKRKNYSSAYFGLFILTFIWIGGGLLSLLSWTHTMGKPISVSLVQGDIPQELKWSPEHLSLSFERYIELTQPLWKKDNFIIWPEAALPIPLQDTKDFIDLLDQKAKESGAHLILGIPVQAQNDRYYNAIITLGQENQFYLKRHLVPFGEYTPSSPILAPLIKQMNIPMSDMTPGRLNQSVFTVGHVKILPAICYEIAFPDLMFETDGQIGFLLTVTNDSWFGESSAKAQHLQMAEMRALEFKRPLLFVGNDGITAIISPQGEIEAIAPQNKPFVLNGSIQPMNGTTPWMRHGTDPILMILIVFLLKSVFEKRALLKKSALKNKSLQATPSVASSE